MSEKQEVHVCKACGTIQIVESAYSKMTELQKATVAAQQAAIDFLESIADGYDQDSAPLHGTSAEHLQCSDVREKIPVVSDVNISQLQKLLVDFFQRNISLEIKETQNGTKNN